MFYYQQRTPVQAAYYDFHIAAGRGAMMLPFITDPNKQYLAKYVLMNEFHRRLHPYSFLKPGDKVVTVGVHDGFIDLGFSSLFVIAALVGPEGHVWAIDPDERNIEPIEAFAAANGIANVTTIRTGVWSERTSLEFVFFRDFSSSNEVRSVFEASRKAYQDLWGDERIERESYTRNVDVDTLDRIVADQIREPIDFLNLTINGAEAEALAGAETLLRSERMTVAFPIQKLSDPLYDHLRSFGFDIAVADAPTKAWDRRQFLYACGTRLPEADLLERGFRPAEIAADPDDPFLFQVKVQDEEGS